MYKRKALNTLILLTIISVILLALNNITSVRVFKEVVIKILFPITKVVIFPFESAETVYTRADKLLNFYRKNEVLNNKIKKLNKQYRDFSYLTEENKRLRNILKFKNRPHGILVPARVMIHTWENYFTEFNINRGKKHGIIKDLPVLNIVDSKWVLLGRVEEVFDNLSRVILITSPHFRCGAQLPDGSLGVIKGNNGWSFKLEYISPNSSIAEGDEVYTSGTGGIFPSGLFIGKIMDVKTLKFSTGKEASVNGIYYPQDSKYLYVLIKK